MSYKLSIYSISDASVRSYIGLARQIGATATEQALERELQRRNQIAKEMAA